MPYDSQFGTSSVLVDSPEQKKATSKNKNHLVAYLRYYNRERDQRIAWFLNTQPVKIERTNGWAKYSNELNFSVAQDYYPFWKNTNQAEKYHA